jgi:hypothetical protein
MLKVMLDRIQPHESDKQLVKVLSNWTRLHQYMLVTPLVVDDVLRLIKLELEHNNRADIIYRLIGRLTSLMRTSLHHDAVRLQHEYVQKSNTKALRARFGTSTGESSEGQA